MTYLYFLIKKYGLHIKAFLLRKNKVGDSYFYKWNRLRSFCQKYKLEIFIETGSYYGLTIDKMINYFKNIHSIEIQHSLYKFNKLYYKNKPEVNIHLGDSKNILPGILEKLNNENKNVRILFWLDGHCSENETGIGENYSPLEFELINIFKYENLLSIIIIDDYRLFDGVNYPSLNKIKELIDEKSYTFTIDSDSLIIKNKIFV